MIARVADKAVETAANQAVKPETDTKNEKSSGAAETEFSKLMKTLLVTEKAEVVSEEELFAGMVQERLKTLKGDDVAKKYKEALDKEVAARKKPDGFVPWEDAGKAALKSLREAGDVSADEAKKVYSAAFSAAQLDDNAGALFDGRGGPGDTTMAFLEISKALEKAKTKLDGIVKDESTLAMRDLDEASNSKPAVATVAGGAASPAGGGHAFAAQAAQVGAGGVVDGAQGFLFKPISDTRGTLVIVTPAQMTGAIDGIVLKSLDGQELERSQYGGVGNGGREHFRFTKPGGSYPDNLSVEIKMKDGTTKSYSIPDPSKRYD